MSDVYTSTGANQDPMMRLDAYNESSELQVFLLTIIDEYNTLRKQRVKLLLFLGEMIYAEKHDGETMGEMHYQFSTGIWSQEFEHILIDIIPELYNVTVETKSTVPYQDPITYLRTPSDITLQSSVNTPPHELGEIVVDATKNKSLTELKFWFDNTPLARMHNNNEVLTKSMINRYVNSVNQNKIVPVWSQLI